MISIPDQVRELLKAHNLNRETTRFQSVDQVALDLGLPPRPPRDVKTWILQVAQAVDAEPELSQITGRAVWMDAL